jgi:hypothetical protein
MIHLEFADLVLIMSKIIATVPEKPVKYCFAKNKQCIVSFVGLHLLQTENMGMEFFLLQQS